MVPGWLTPTGPRAFSIRGFTIIRGGLGEDSRASDRARRGGGRKRSTDPFLKKGGGHRGILVGPGKIFLRSSASGGKPVRRYYRGFPSKKEEGKLLKREGLPYRVGSNCLAGRFARVECNKRKSYSFN